MVSFPINCYLETHSKHKQEHAKQVEFETGRLIHLNDKNEQFSHKLCPVCRITSGAIQYGVPFIDFAPVIVACHGADS